MLRAGLLLVLLVGGSAWAQGWEEQFSGRRLDDRWQWRVPAVGPTLSLSDRPGWLRVRLPDRMNGFNHWSEPTPVDEAAQLRAAAPEGNWELTARLGLHEFSPTSNFLVGLTVGDSDEFLLCLGPLHADGMEGKPEVWFEPTGTSGLFRVPGEAKDVHLRLVRTGNLYRGLVSRDGKTWTEAGCCIMGGRPRFLGLLAKTFAAGPPVVVDVDYVRLRPLPTPAPDGPRMLVGVGGNYPTGYRGLLARLGLPYEVLLDYQLADSRVLERFDLLLIGSLSHGIDGPAREALMRYVRAGGTALLDGEAYPPPSVVPGKGRRLRDLPDILLAGTHNPLQPWLGTADRFAAGESRYHFAPDETTGLQVLAYYDRNPAMKGKRKGTVLPPGTPAIWAKPLGKGLLVYSSPSIGASLSWGPTHDQLAEALVQCLAGGRMQPQLVEEGVRFGRKQSVRTECAVQTEEPATGPAPFERVRLPVSSAPVPRTMGRIRAKTTPMFNLTGTYRPGEGEGQLLLNRWNERYLVQVVLDGDCARLSRIENGKTVETAKLSLGSAVEIPFVLKERRSRIALLVGGRRAELSADGLWEGALAVAGKGLAHLRYQQIGPAFLSDDFMRGEDERGGWQTGAGKWSVRATGDPKMGANPFTYRGECAQGTGWSATGLPFWDDYRFSVSAKPTSKAGAVALAFHFHDGEDYLLFRLPVSESGSAKGRDAALVRVHAGTETVLARGVACLAKGQWYRLSVWTENGTATGLVDGREVLRAEDSVLHEGKVALMVRNGGAEFDDMAVRPLGGDEGPQLVELDGSVPRFAGTMDRDTWAGTALQWRADRQVPGLFWRHGAFSGDVDLTFACAFGGHSAPGRALSLLLAPAEGSADSGYGLVLRPLAAGGDADKRYEVEFTRQGVSAGRATVVSGPKPALAMRRIGGSLTAWVDGHEVLSCPSSELLGTCCRLGFQSAGFLPRISGLRLRAGQVLDYYFDHAPTDWWVGGGTWELAVRWPCTPEWSWLAGESRGVAALWHKHEFMGDQTLDLHVGPRTVDHGDKRPREICRAFNVVLCGNGKDVDSGYSFVVGADKAGAGATLSRHGEVVAREPAYRIFSDAHNQWINVRAEKRGASVRLWVGDQEILSWRDPDPLPGGRLAVWTRDNGIMVPRVTIYHGG